MGSCELSLCACILLQRSVFARLAQKPDRSRVDLTCRTSKIGRRGFFAVRLSRGEETYGSASPAEVRLPSLVVMCRRLSRNDRLSQKNSGKAHRRKEKAGGVSEKSNSELDYDNTSSNYAWVLAYEHGPSEDEEPPTRACSRESRNRWFVLFDSTRRKVSV